MNNQYRRIDGKRLREYLKDVDYKNYALTSILACFEPDEPASGECGKICSCHGCCSGCEPDDEPDHIVEPVSGDIFRSQIDRLAIFLMENYSDEIGKTADPSGEGAIDFAIRLLSKPSSGDCECTGRKKCVSHACQDCGARKEKFCTCKPAADRVEEIREYVTKEEVEYGRSKASKALQKIHEDMKYLLSHINRLEAQVQRMREALEKIATHTGLLGSEQIIIARQALEEDV